MLINETGNATMVAGAGNDTIFAGAGNDILDGGEGNDTLYGEAGNDTYILRIGSGRDTIFDTDATAGNTDTIYIGSNLTPNDITLRRIGNDLIVKITDTSDKLTVRDYFKNDSPLNRIERIQFTNGTVWDVQEMYHQVALSTETDDIIYGSSGDGHDLLVGGGGDDVIFGDKDLTAAFPGWSTTVESTEMPDGFVSYTVIGNNQGWTEGTFKGDDTIYAGAGNDFVAAGGGGDEVYGGLGDDVVFGEGGDDFIEGGGGNDWLLGNSVIKRQLFEKEVFACVGN